MNTHILSSRLRQAIALAALLLTIGNAAAGSLTVSPLRLTFENGANIVLVTVANPGAEEILVQAEAVSWQQSGSEHKLLETDAIIAMPPIFKLAAGASQMVRIGFVGVAPASSQQTYRLLVSEVPTQAKSGGISIAVRHSLPVLVMPAGPVAAQLAARLGPAGNQESGLDLNNRGNALARISHWRLRDAKGAIVAEADGPGYLLSGATQRLPLAPGVSRLASQLEIDDDSGSHKLTVEP